MRENTRNNFISTSTVLVLFLICKGNAQYNRGLCPIQVRTSTLLGPNSKPVAFGPIVGNGTAPGFSVIDTCCDGWKKKSNKYPLECEPICEKGCTNGICTRPGICTCNNGHTKNDHQQCVPTCPIGCSHGVCQGNRCICLLGYSLSANGKFCNPVCPGGCGIGGTCIGPLTCHCHEGHILNKATNKCGAICTHGYHHVNGKCQAACPRGCKNGVCTQPNVCTCLKGWTPNTAKTVCTPHCNPPCLNADCTGPNVCSCKKGYISDPRTKNRCVAHCPGGCHNGQCSAPNFCICNPGFVKDPIDASKCVLKGVAIARGMAQVVGK